MLEGSLLLFFFFLAESALLVAAVIREVLSERFFSPLT